MNPLIRAVIAALPAALPPGSGFGSEADAFALNLPYGLGPVEIDGTPAPGMSVESVKLNAGPVSGFATLIASLPAELGSVKLGAEELFIELDGSGGGMNGLRFYAERFGFAAGAQDGTVAAAEGLVAGSRTGSRAHSMTGSAPGGGAFASAERAQFQFSGARPPLRPEQDFGNQADRGDEWHLRARFRGVQLAEFLLEALIPELSAHPGLRAELSGNFGVTGEVSDQSLQLSAALGIDLDGRPALRISARLSLDSSDPFVHRIDGVIAFDGVDSAGEAAVESGQPRPRQLAAMLGMRLGQLGRGSAFITAAESAALQFSEQGTASEASLHRTIAADLPRRKSRHVFERMAQLLSGLGLTPQELEF